MEFTAQCPRFRMRFQILLVSCLMCTALSSAAWATSVRPHGARTVSSPNQKYMLKTNPKTKKHVIYKAGQKKPLWSFENATFIDEFMVSDDGQSVLWVSWRYCKVDNLDEPCMILFRNGSKPTIYSYKKVSQPRRYRSKEKGPIGSFWRIWRDRELKRKGNTVTIPVAGEKPLVIQFGPENA